MHKVLAMLPKGWMLFVVVTVALGAAGGGYAAWTSSIHVESAISTGSVEVVWDQQTDSEFVEVLVVGDDGTERFVPMPVPDEKKGFTECRSDLQDGLTATTVNVALINAYPSYSCIIVMGGIVAGTVPVHISSIKVMATDPTLPVGEDDTLGKDVDVNIFMTRKFEDPTAATGFRCDRTPVGVSTQLEPNDRFCLLMRLHVNQIAKQNSQYEAGVWVEFIQWNEATAAPLPTEYVLVATEPTPARLVVEYSEPNATISANQEVFDAQGNLLGFREIGRAEVVEVQGDKGQTVLRAEVPIGNLDPDRELILSASVLNKTTLLSPFIPGGVIIVPFNFVRLIGLEVNQTIQDWEDTVQQIRRKPTVVRAHVQPSLLTNIPNVVLKLHGTNGVGVPLPGSPLSAVNPGGVVTARTNAESLRQNFHNDANNSSATFYLPWSWRTGIVRLRVVSTSHAMTCSEAADTNNDCRVTVGFNVTDNPQVKWVRVQNGANLPSFGNVFELIGRFRAIYPIRTVVSQIGYLNYGAGGVSLGTLNDKLALMRFWDGCWSIFGCQRLYYGVLENVGGGGLAKGIPGKVSSGVMPNADPFVPGSTTYGRNRHAHEIGHSLFRHHAANQADNGTTVINGTTYKKGYCNSVASLSAPEFPYKTIVGTARAALGPMNLGVQREIWGMDTKRLEIINPQNTFELMSYCSTATDGQARWISRFTYNGLRNRINSLFSGPEVAVVATPGAVYTVIAGNINMDALAVNDNGQRPAEFLPAVQLPSDVMPPSSADPKGRFSLLGFNDAGKIVTDIPFTPDIQRADIPAPTDKDIPEVPNPVGTFMIPVADDPVTSTLAMIRVVDRETNRIIGEMVRSPNAPKALGKPVVDFTPDILNLNVSWAFEDGDGDPLSHLLFVDYSACFLNDAKSRLGLVETYDAYSSADGLSIPPEALRGTPAQVGDCAVAVVQASDGLNSVEARSDPFEIPDQPPMVEIVSLGLNEVIAPVDLVSLEGFGRDNEDGELTGDSLLWELMDTPGGFGKVLGVLGTGEAVEVFGRELGAPGTIAFIRLSGRDSAGNIAIETVELQLEGLILQ